jgi:hypothetical protein
VKIRYSQVSAERNSRAGRKGCLYRLFSPFLLVVGLLGLMLVVPAFTRNQSLLMKDCQLSPKFPDKVLRWCSPIMKHSSEADLPPDLVAALIWHESGGNPSIYSRSGAVGLMQVMPRDGRAADFQCKNGPCFANRPTSKELENPNFNIQYGTRILRNLLDHHKDDMREALKFYGPHDAGYSYADTILVIYKQYGKK